MPGWVPAALLFYLLLGLGSGAAAWWLRGVSPLEYGAPWFGSPQHLVSAVLGVALAVGLVALTRALVARSAWVRTLHTELRSVAVTLPLHATLALAVASALGEELLFRTLLTPMLGVWLQALAFGLLHQGVRGAARWVWMGWAAAVGLLFGVLYVSTGSLLGPLIAHALVNAVNLEYLKRHDTRPAKRLGGLLGSPTDRPSSQRERSAQSAPLGQRG